jgi:hypothetical protein
MLSLEASAQLSLFKNNGGLRPASSTHVPWWERGAPRLSLAAVPFA